MRRSLAGLVLLAPLLAAPFSACGPTPESLVRDPSTLAPSPPEPVALAEPQPLEPSPVASATLPTSPPAESDAEGGAKHDASCPEGMLRVSGSYCADVERQCLKKERNKPNHIDICHKFAHKTKCRGAEEKRDFCIDKYEYPNRAGAHPPWMVSWYDAQATCESKGKRLCYESEWVTACEGPGHTPFPYGWDRDQSACNIDNTWVDPRIKEMYSKSADISEPELERLDQSVASGAMERCVSGYGVSDMTGNFDEWVTSDQPPDDKSEWAGLKGGAWGHVRNACRPMTTSHPPEFTYYFISFRCCADAAGAPPYVPKRGKKPPAVEPADKAPLPRVTHPAGPSARKVQPENAGLAPPIATSRCRNLRAKRHAPRWLSTLFT